MNRRALVFMLLLMETLYAFSCSDSEHRLPFGKSTRVIINLGMPRDSHAGDTSLIERVRRFLVPDAIAQSAPANFSNIEVRVTAPDIGAIEKSFGPYATISFNVPAGSFRNFEVTAYVAPGDPSPAASFRGTALANLPSGQTVSIPIVMKLNTTKIAVPDLNNARIIIMESLGNGWLPLTEGDLSFPESQFYPYDIDYDARGRLYFTNSDFQSSGGVWRIDSINNPSPEPIVTGGEHFALGVDRVRNRIYYSSGSTGNEVYVYEGSESSQVCIAPGTVNGIDVDQSTGKIYLATIDELQKWDKDNGLEALLPSPSPGVAHYFDVVVRGGHVYATVNYGANDPDNCVIRTNLDLDAGELEVLHRATENFVGPTRFVAPLNSGFSILDDTYDFDNNDTITSFSDIFDLNWNRYQNQSDPFSFFMTGG